MPPRPSGLTKNIHRAACVAALYELSRVGYLEGITLQEIANLLDLGNRSTAYRYLQDVAEVELIIAEVHKRLAKIPPLKSPG